MECPQCGAPIESENGAKVIDSRKVPDGSVRRRRVCPRGHRFTTYERTSEAEQEINAGSPRTAIRKIRELADELEESFGNRNV